jgi:hypothetical protein
VDIQLPKLYKDYGQYSNYRNFPLDLDGLKPVERRVLLSAYKIAREKFVKSRQVDAYTIGHFHPHGECVTGETKILLLDGTTIQVKDLVERDNFWVYSCTPDGVIKPGLAHSARIVKKVSTIYRISIDNETYFECTEDHPIMIRDGSFVEAKNLKENDSLMPLYLRQEDGYTYYKDNSRIICREEKVSWMVVRELINKNLDDLVGLKNYHTHHKNERRNDDRPENLDFLYYKDHTSETAKNRTNESNKIISEKVKSAYRSNKNNFKERALEGLEKGRQKMFSEGSPIREKIREKNSKLILSYNKRFVEDRILKILKNMISNNIKITETNYEENRKKIYNGPFWKTIFKKFGSIEEATKQAKTYNHIVTKIEKINLEKEIDVYDISVEKYHNFALENGIFVHNCYGTIVQLVRQGFLEGQGNFGTTVGVEPVGPAAPRYTECRIQKQTLELAFKYIKYVPIVPTELNDEEPLYLPTMYPVCLLGQSYTQGIGFGFKTLIPCYKVEDLHKRLLWLIGERKTKPTIAPISDCKITATEKDLEDLLTTGKAKIAVEGIFTTSPRTNKLTLTSWPPGKKFESLLNAFSKELEAGLIGVIDLSSKNQTEIVFEVLRERNRDKIFQDFIKKMKRVVQGAVSFEIQVVDINQKVMIKSVDSMLMDTYKMFKDVNEKVLKDEIQKIKEVIDEYSLLEKARKPLTICIQSGMTVEETVKVVSDAVNCDEKDIAVLIDKYRIKKLLTLDTDTEGLEKEKQSKNHLLSSLVNYVLNQYREMK